jgi:hypothetical protein
LAYSTGKGHLFSPVNKILPLAFCACASLYSSKRSVMLARQFAPDTGSTSSPVADVGDDIAALRNNVSALATDVKRLAAYGPELAHDSYATAVRRNPVQATLIAAAVGFVACLILSR